MFWAEKGCGAFVNERRLRVSARRDLNEAVFATGIPFAAVDRAAPPGVRPHAGRADAAGRRHPPLRRRRARPRLGRGRPLRRLLGARPEPWDMAAGLLIVREAGGYATDPHGGDPRDAGNVVAGNPHLHAQLREAVVRACVSPRERA